MSEIHSAEIIYNPQSTSPFKGVTMKGHLVSGVISDIYQYKEGTLPIPNNPEKFGDQIIPLGEYYLRVAYFQTEPQPLAEFLESNDAGTLAMDKDVVALLKERLKSIRQTPPTLLKFPSKDEPRGLE